MGSAKVLVSAFRPQQGGSFAAYKPNIEAYEVNDEQKFRICVGARPWEGMGRTVPQQQCTAELESPVAACARTNHTSSPVGVRKAMVQIRFGNGIQVELDHRNGVDLGRVWNLANRELSRSRVAAQSRVQLSVPRSHLGGGGMWAGGCQVDRDNIPNIGGGQCSSVTAHHCHHVGCLSLAGN